MAPFWKRKKLSDMSVAEWEAICDGCGSCCLHKIQDVDTGDIAFTNVSCHQLDLETCKCSDYCRRQQRVPDCINLNHHNIQKLEWLPNTCAYRLLDEGKELSWWHPLVSGDPETVHTAGISVRGKGICEDDVEDMKDHIEKWLVKAEDPINQDDR